MGPEPWRQRLEVRRPLLVQNVSCTSEFTFPAGKEVVRTGSLQGSISLEQGPTKPPPLVEIAMFHVEHAPVENSPPRLGRALDQLVDLGMDSLDGEGRDKLARTGGNPTACVDLETVGCDANTKGEGSARLVDTSSDPGPARP